MRLLAVGLLLFGLAVPAQAEIITFSADFVASGFNPAAPVDPVTGTFSVTFDNSSNLMEQTRGVRVWNLNFPIDSAPGFAYGAEADAFILGGVTNGVQTLVPDTDDFILSILNLSTHPTPVEFVYTRKGSDAFYKGSLTVTPTPEPAAVVLLTSGAVGLLLRRKRLEV
jgi:hypothetical protein